LQWTESNQGIEARKQELKIHQETILARIEESINHYFRNINS